MSSVFTAISFILSVALFAVARRGVPRPAGEFGADAPSRGAFIVDFFTGVVFGLFFRKCKKYINAFFVHHIVEGNIYIIYYNTLYMVRAAQASPV